MKGFGIRGLSVVATALKDTQRFFEQAPELAEEAAILAINDTVRRDGMALLETEMRKDIDFSRDYLNDRMGVTKLARHGSLEAVISGRDRPTSLARFARGQTPENTRGRRVVLKVKGQGGPVSLDRAFLLRLRNGNVGLAIRLPKGREPDRSYGAVHVPSASRSKSDLWLLYGPSVDQVLRGVANDNADEIIDMVSTKFYRQFGRLARGR